MPVRRDFGFAPLQTMTGRKPLAGANADIIGYVNATSSTGSITAPKSCIALIYAIGGGGPGATDVNSGAGGGAGAFFKRARISQGQTISYSVAAATTGGSGDPATNGNDTTVTLPSGYVVTAGGGKKGLSGGAGGAGGIGSGGDINRTGGAGGAGGVVGSTGGTGGGAGGSTFGGLGGGGGSAGFGDVLSILAGGAGSGTVGVAPGGGGHNNGASGLVVIFLIRTY